MPVIPKDYYTLDALAGTITLLAPYDDLCKEQLVHILDLNTSDVVYDVYNKRNGLDITDGVITYTSDNNIVDDTDDIRIIIDDTAELSVSINKLASAIDDSGDTPFINVSGVDGGAA